MHGFRRLVVLLLATLVLVVAATDSAYAKKKRKKKKPAEDPYAEYVWPPPPDDARIKLEDVIAGRADVEAKTSWQRTLLGASPQSAYDTLEKPFAVAFDPQGRIIVTDSGNAALIRFDRKEGRMDVLGTQGAVRLKLPLGLDVSPDGTIYVADAGLRQVVAYDPEGKRVAAYGKGEELTNPTDVALSPDGKRLFVADSKVHSIVIYEVKTGKQASSFGVRGKGPGEFNFPTALAFGPEGNLFVLDQLNSRVQVFDADNQFVDEFGSLGVGFGNFVRPKDLAVDELGLIYVTDNAFNNVQLFDADFTLLTFVGAGGVGPGRFHGASGVAVQGDRFAVVDQLGKRLQVFRFIVPKIE
jgi:DNA-binding beta-propeller fold protein YncE